MVGEVHMALMQFVLLGIKGDILAFSIAWCFMHLFSLST